ncbi:MAG: HAMP domain-containing histidine kinase [Chloroflexi bacterium]|nr:HAMP domain-containing histidine kinase [Chloroflexota bacterium]
MAGIDRVLALVAQLARPEERCGAAQALAREVGAADLLIFLVDREVAALLPAPGFAQTLPRGRQWQAFLRACTVAGEHEGTVPFPDATSRMPAFGIATDEAVLVLLGGAPRRDALVSLRTLLPLLAAAFQGERLATVAEAQISVARESAARAAALAEVLDHTRRELEQALRTREEFLAAAAHDLKNPLAAIKGAAQLLQRRIARGAMLPPERLSQALAGIDVSATRMAALLDDLLDVTRLHMLGTLDLDRQPTDLIALSRAVAEEQQAGTESHVIQVHSSLPTLVGSYDRARLGRALANLLSNAVKYSPGGGTVSITVEREGPAWAVVSVQDEGVGIPPEDLPHIFERFHRGSNVVGRIAGTGIGLASVRQVVEAHGGTVSVRSEVGRGSCFTVRLPLSQPSGSGSGLAEAAG